jgi:tripartite-type tricarboxylate transporter receptor subunit TctC
MKKIALALIGTLAALPAPAQDYPSRPITLLTPFSPGNIVDLSARAFAEPFKKALAAEAVVVANREGAAGIVAMTALAQAKPDGYTLWFGPQGQLTIQPHQRADLAYKFSDVTPICQVSESHFFISAKPDGPYKDFPALLAAAKNEPGKLSFAVSGIGAIPHLQWHMIARRAGVELNAVAYRNLGQIKVDILSGQIAMGVLVVGATYAEGLKHLAVLSEKRLPNYPDVPTSGEFGFPATTPGFVGVMARAGVPEPILAKIEKACETAAKDESFAKVIARSGSPVAYLNRADFTKRMAEDFKVKGEAVKTLNMKVQ